MTRPTGVANVLAMKDGHLFVSLMADGGIYEFEPMSSIESG